jgi:5-methylcytosine-specific restriction endonuclease McrA
MIADKKVLVLNRSWMAIGILPLERAIVKVASTYKDGTPKAKIIDCVENFQPYTWEDWTKLTPKDNEEFLRSVHANFRIPEVIQYTRFDKNPSRKIPYNRKTIFLRDNYTCQYCNKMKSSNELSLDHVIPRCQGGLSTWENVVVACVDCNSKKAGRTPKEANLKLLREPKKPKQLLFYSEFKIKSWSNFLNVSYWNSELENDN